ncbi:MAG: ankyrin repeat domain-containing protein [Blastocatellia bacterium]|nr:ankyrin repeat domain-containing protein [Blastocatellia bacterium]
MSLAENLIGKVLDKKYLVEKILGQGGMGAVFLATHVGTRRPVALKIIMPRYMNQVEFVERFKREARASGQLLHPHVVNVTDFGFAATGQDQVAYLVMEYLNGKTLAELLQEHPRLPLKTTVDIIEQVCLAIQEAHRKGIIHRDLKPENIFLQDNGRGSFLVKVLDFGIAKLNEAASVAITHTALPESEETEATTLVQESVSQAVASQIGVGSIETAPAAFLDQTQVSFGKDTDDTCQHLDGTALYPASGGNQAALTPAAASSEKSRHGSSSHQVPNENDVTLQISSVATPSDAQNSRSEPVSELVTNVGTVLGTPHYMSPEQCQGIAIDQRSDLYSLGVILYRMLTGEVLFTGSFPQLLYKHINQEPPDPREKNPRLPMGIVRLLKAALSKEPDRRPPSAQAFAAALKANAEGERPIFQAAWDLFSQHRWPLLSLSALVHVPYFVVTGLIFTAWLTLLRESGPMPISTLRQFHSWSWLLTGGLLLWAGAINGAAFHPLVALCQLYPDRRVSLSATAKAFFSHWGQLTGTAMRLVFTLLFRFGRLSPQKKGTLVGMALFAPVLVTENITGREVLERSETLVRRFSPPMGAILVRYALLILFALLAAPGMFVMTGLFFSTLGEEKAEMLVGHSGTLSGLVWVALVFSFVPWLVVTLGVPYLATVASLFYDKLCQIGGEQTGAEDAEEPVELVEFKSVPFYRKPVAAFALTWVVLFGAWMGLKDRLLLIATGNKLNRMAETALAVGANPNARIRPEFFSDFETTPLLKALEADDPKMVNLLLDAGADVNLTNINGWTPLMQVISVEQDDLVALLLRRNAKVNVQHNQGGTPLIEATQHGNLDLIEELFRFNANPNLSLNSGETALMIAVDKGYLYAARELLQHGANLDAQDAEGWSPMLLAAKHGDPHMLRLLLEFHADANWTDPEGWTPLLIAAGRGHTEAVKVLLAAGADRTVVMNDQTPRQIADERGFKEIVELLDAAKP